MDVAAWCQESRLWVVAGKGGVGKTTIAAALARMAAGVGLSVLVIELEGKQGLPSTFGRRDPLGYEPTALFVPEGSDAARWDVPGPDPARGTSAPGDRFAAGSVWARRLTSDDALLEYLADHGLQRVSKRLVSTGVLDVVATAIPGIRDVLVLGKVKQLERSGAADLVVVDAPATGHAMTFLTSASGLLDAARSGPVRSQAADVVELLQDPDRCRVMLVTVPEETPVSETVEAAFLLEDRVGVRLAPVVVNCAEAAPADLSTEADAAARAAGVTLGRDQLDALDAARQFRLRRCELAFEQIDRLRRELPLPQLHVPRLDAGSIGPVELETLASALAARVGSLSSHTGAA